MGLAPSYPSLICIFSICGLPPAKTCGGVKPGACVFLMHRPRLLTIAFSDIFVKITLWTMCKWFSQNNRFFFEIFRLFRPLDIFFEHFTRLSGDAIWIIDALVQWWIQSLDVNSLALKITKRYSVKTAIHAIPTVRLTLFEAWSKGFLVALIKFTQTVTRTLRFCPSSLLLRLHSLYYIIFIFIYIYLYYYYIYYIYLRQLRIPPSDWSAVQPFRIIFIHSFHIGHVFIGSFVSFRFFTLSFRLGCF